MAEVSDTAEAVEETRTTGAERDEEPATLALELPIKRDRALH